MKRRSYGRDAGLTLRIFTTASLLGLLYVVFAVVLFNVLSVGLIPMILIVVGITSSPWPPRAPRWSSAIRLPSCTT